MSLGRLKWLTIVLAIAFLFCVQGVAMGFVMPAFGRPAGHAVSIIAFSAGVIVYTLLVYRTIDRMQGRIVAQNEELAAINAVSRAVAGSLNIERTMDRALDNVMRITHAAAGEIVTYGEGGEDLRRFVVGPQGELDRLSELVAAGVPDPDVPTDGLRRLADLTVIPLTGQGREIGAIRLLRDEAGLHDAEGDSLLTGIGAQIAVAVMAGELYEDVIRRQRITQVLYEIAVDITSLQNSQEVLWSIVERAREMLRADAAAVSLFDQAGEGFTLAAHSGRPQAFRSPHAAGSWFPLGTTAPQPEIADGQGNGCPIADPSFSCHAAPLRAGPDHIGELSVSVSGSRRFNEEEQHLLNGMADLAAIAVQKSRLLERERQVAVLEERERLAREMHDSLAQVLGYLHLKSETALGKLRVNDISKAEEQLREMATLSKEAYADVREAILGLRENVSPTRGLVDALREYLQKFSRQAGVAVQLEANGDDRVCLSPEAEVQLMRVIQEALTNVRKHANADRARVSIGRSGGEAAIVVEDNGRGFDSEGLRQTDMLSFGLLTMRERIERVGGRFAVDSVPGKGTRVQIFLPVNGRHDHDS
jgi:two-component system nitrate/nitrite sensor histidine kinase NarX